MNNKDAVKIHMHNKFIMNKCMCTNLISTRAHIKVCKNKITLQNNMYQNTCSIKNSCMVLLALVLRSLTPQNKQLVSSLNKSNDKLIEAHLFAFVGFFWHQYFETVHECNEYI